MQEEFAISLHDTDHVAAINKKLKAGWRFYTLVGSVIFLRKPNEPNGAPLLKV